MNGFLLIDKPVGSNSFKLVIALRKLSNQRRVGYAGTLDPLASGLMIMALGEYTKLLPYLEAKDKIYQVKIALGQESNTYDADGEISDCKVVRIPDLEEIKQILRTDFQGEIKQIPPKFSAIQIAGKRAYEMARKGQQFEMKPRSVQIFSSTVLSYSYPMLELEIHCSSGTYIRSIAHDLGQKLECGGYVKELRRIKIGNIGISDSVPLSSLDRQSLNNLIVPAQKVFEDRPTISLTESQYQVISKGNFVDNELKVTGELLALYKNQVVGIIETTENGRKLKFKKKLNIF